VRTPPQRFCWARCVRHAPHTFSTAYPLSLAVVASLAPDLVDVILRTLAAAGEKRLGQPIVVKTSLAGTTFGTKAKWRSAASRTDIHDAIWASRSPRTRSAQEDLRSPRTFTYSIGVVPTRIRHGR